MGMLMGLKQQHSQDEGDAQQENERVIFHEPRLKKAQHFTEESGGRRRAVERAVDDLEVESGIDQLRAPEKGADDDGPDGLVDVVFVIKKLVDERKACRQPPGYARGPDVKNIGDENPQERRTDRGQDQKPLGAQRGSRKRRNKSAFSPRMAGRPT
jgi:hypothetical protein